MSNHNGKTIIQTALLLICALLMPLGFGCAKKSGDGGGASVKEADSAAVAVNAIGAPAENDGGGDASLKEIDSAATDAPTPIDTVIDISMESKDGGKLYFKKYKLVVSDSTISDVEISFTCPAAVPNPAALVALQKNFIAQAFGEKYAGLGPSEVVKRVEKDLIDERRSLDEHSCTYDFAYSDTVFFPIPGFLQYKTFYYEYTCGAHGNSYASYSLYNLADGSRAEPKDIFVKGWERDVTKLIIARSEVDLQDGYAEEKDFIPTCDMLSFMDSSGITFTYNSYQIANYAAGPQYILVPWDELKPYLNKGSALYPRLKF